MKYQNYEKPPESNEDYEDVGICYRCKEFSDLNDNGMCEICSDEDNWQRKEDEMMDRRMEDY